jgi:hypothetical protein
MYDEQALRLLEGFLVGREAERSMDGTSHHHAGHQYTFYRVPLGRENVVREAAVAAFEAKHPINLHEHYTPVFKLALDLDEPKDANGEVIECVPLRPLLRALLKFLRDNITVLGLPDTKPFYEASFFATGNTRIPHLEDPYCCIVLKSVKRRETVGSRTIETSLNYHLRFPHLLVDKCFSKELLQRFVFQHPDFARFIDIEQLKHGSLRTYLSDKHKKDDRMVQCGRPMILDSIHTPEQPEIEASEVFNGSIDHRTIYAATSVRCDERQRGVRAVGSLREAVRVAMRERFAERMNPASPRVTPSNWIVGTDNFEPDRLRESLVDFEDVALRDAVTHYLNKYICMITKHDGAPVYVERFIDREDGTHSFALRRRQDMELYFKHVLITWQIQVGTLRNGDPKTVSKTKTAFQIWDEHPDKLRFDKIVFDPSGEARSGLLNLWTGRKTERDVCAEYADYTYTDEAGKEWGVRDVLAHLYTYWASGNEEHFKYIIRWLASCLQYPERKLEVALLLVSDEGTGKDLLSCPLFELIFGKHFMRSSTLEDIVGRFANYERAVAVVLDEIDSIDGPAAARMKAAITDDKMRVERKNFMTFWTNNFTNFMLFTNNPHQHVVDIGPNQRRCVMLTSPLVRHRVSRR